jgi:hypothetical protein
VCPWDLSVSAREAMAPSAVHIAVPVSGTTEPIPTLAKATPAVGNGPGWAQNMTGEAELVTPRPAWWWTATAPQDAPGYDEQRQHLTALPLTVRARMCTSRAASSSAYQPSPPRAAISPPHVRIDDIRMRSWCRHRGEGRDERPIGLVTTGYTYHVTPLTAPSYSTFPTHPCLGGRRGALQDLSTVTRQQVLDYFTNTWATTETLFSALQGKLCLVAGGPCVGDDAEEEDEERPSQVPDSAGPLLAGEEPFYRPPYHELRHPLIFYYGHPAVFYVNKVKAPRMRSAVRWQIRRTACQFSWGESENA